MSCPACRPSHLISWPLLGFGIEEAQGLGRSIEVSLFSFCLESRPDLCSHSLVPSHSRSPIWRQVCWLEARCSGPSAQAIDVIPFTLKIQAVKPPLTLSICCHCVLPTFGLISFPLSHHFNPRKSSSSSEDSSDHSTLCLRHCKCRDHFG